MSSELEYYVNKAVSVITGDGRNIVGVLKGFDQTINLVLEGSHERVYRANTGVSQIPLGLYVVRGDNVAVIGELDEDLDRRLDLSKIQAAPLEPLWEPA
ncbi:U6 snRNA-associated Sm-like protein LSm8 [Aphelenchoides bicaudatus]|nr:U6 snRNA-associated Sm-like protein LSm8 [Aphelenchoides bicaudatus]